MATNNSRIENVLNKRLVKLQGESAVVQSVVAKTNQLEYENLCEIYIWWRTATSIEGYLDKAYEPRVRRVFNEHVGLNFKRLLYLMYGNNGIHKDSLERKNEALRKLHEEYEKNANLYTKDGVNKLAGYIKAQGGIDGLIKTVSLSNVVQAPQPSQSNVSSTISDPVAASPLQAAPASAQIHMPLQVSGRSLQTYRPRIEVKITDAMRQTALIDEAATFFSRNVNSQHVAINPPIATNKEGYGLALVKRTSTGYDVIGATDSTQGIRELLVSAYRKQYAALPSSMRCFVEIIKTQSLPSNLLKLYDKLTELSASKHDDNTRKKIQRRVMYVVRDNALVLSPTYSKSGVVTTAKLKTAPFEGVATDCFMPTRCRKLVEQRMLATHDFNLFAPSNAEYVPRFNRAGLASHVLRLDNKADGGDFVFVEFWPFEEQMGAANEQLYYVPSFTQSCKTKFTLPQNDFKTLAYDHINKWLASYGDHITRPANQLFELNIDSNGFTLGFDYVNNVFRNHAQCLFATKLQKDINYSATFLSKDICLALHGIGDLQLSSDIDVACSSEALVLSFSTEVADYTVVVPTTTRNRRSEAPFCTYSAVISVHADVTEANDNEIYDDLVTEQALAKVDKALTDDAIDKLLGVEPDSYEDILEGWLPQAYEEDVDVEWTNGAEQ